jgi:hypothetical protein
VSGNCADQVLEGAVLKGLHRPDRSAGDAGDGFEGEITDEAEDYHFALVEV